MCRTFQGCLEFLNGNMCFQTRMYAAWFLTSEMALHCQDRDKDCGGKNVGKELKERSFFPSIQILKPTSGNAQYLVRRVSTLCAVLHFELCYNYQL